MLNFGSNTSMPFTTRYRPGKENAEWLSYCPTVSKLTSNTIDPQVLVIYEFRFDWILNNHASHPKPQRKHRWQNQTTNSFPLKHVVPPKCLKFKINFTCQLSPDMYWWWWSRPGSLRLSPQWIGKKNDIFLQISPSRCRNLDTLFSQVHELYYTDSIQTIHYMSENGTCWGSLAANISSVKRIVLNCVTTWFFFTNLGNTEFLAQ